MYCSNPLNYKRIATKIKIESRSIRNAQTHTITKEELLKLR